MACTNTTASSQGTPEGFQTIDNLRLEPTQQQAPKELLMDFKQICNLWLAPTQQQPHKARP
jgi:hypothetical protein